MTRIKFERDLEALHNKLIKMGGLVEDAIEKSIKALVNQDEVLAKEVIENDKQIGALTGIIESESLKILLRQQPVASDLRTISTALKIVTDMDRIGDQARDICWITLHLCEEEYQTKLIVIPQMAELIKVMVKGCIDSFVTLDTILARKVIDMDNDVDAMFKKVKDNMINLIKKQPDYADQAIYLMMVAKYLEKIGDHAENIADWVMFCVTGQRKNVKLL